MSGRAWNSAFRRADSGAVVLFDEGQAAAAQQAERTAHGWYRWLRQFPWGAHATLTFVHEPSPEAGLRLADAWLRRLEQHVCRDVIYVGVVEKMQGRVHVHVLLGGVGDRMVQKRVAPHWPHGRVAVQDGTMPPRVRYVARKLVEEPVVILPPSNLRSRCRRLRWRAKEIRRRSGGPVGT